MGGRGEGEEDEASVVEEEEAAAPLPCSPPGGLVYDFIFD